MLIREESLMLNKDPVLAIISSINNNPSEPVEVVPGVYEIGHFSPDMLLPNYQSYPKLDGVDSSGVCDGYRDILDKCPELLKEGRDFVITLTPILKENQSSDGGWRWHKWGTYIGKQVPTTEYIYDEPLIEKVYCYQILEKI